MAESKQGVIHGVKGMVSQAYVGTCVMFSGSQPRNRGIVVIL